MTSPALPPLESNPEVMNKYLQKLGVSGKWNMVDVMGLDSDMLGFVPRPVAAVLLLFPITDAYELYKQKEENVILEKGQTISPDVFFLKQTVSNACGTVALVHSIANNTDKINVTEGPLKHYLNEAKDKDASGKGSLLENSVEIINAHKELAQEGQTRTPGSDEKINHHFIVFVHKDGILYELDGRKPFPVNHGPTTPDSLLEDAAKVCREFMARDPNEVRFTVVALTSAE